MNYYLVTAQDMHDSFKSEYSKIIEAENPVKAGEQIESPMLGGTPVITSIKMISNPETSYTLLKNHLHNTLELTKADIRKMVEEAIENIVERRLDVFLEYNDGIQRVIDSAIREKSFNKLMWGNSHNLDEEIQNKIVEHVTEKLLSDIGLEVRIKNNDK